MTDDQLGRQRLDSEQTKDKQWPSLGYEELPWQVDYDNLSFVSKTRRRRLSPTYHSAIPLEIATRPIALCSELMLRLNEMVMQLVRFDSDQARRGYNLPALLLRSESSASSQIEHLTSSVRNVALAELSADAPSNARLVAGNVAAMRAALDLEGPLDVEGICAIHRALMEPSGLECGGILRDQPVWVGGDGISPHGARFVPPASARLQGCLDDLVRFMARTDLHPLVKAAIAHAQFETIHPFIDGNGRTGRTLLHRILKEEEVLASAALPVSAGLLHNVDAYMVSLVAYQAGEPEAVVEEMLDALELALVVGQAVARALDQVFASWEERIDERRSAAIWRLPALLAEQPVVSAAYVAQHLGVSVRAATTVIARAQERGMVRPVGAGKRSVFYQADELLEVLEEVASMQGIRRMIARRF